MATRGPRVGQCGPNANKNTRPILNWIVGIHFQILAGNTHFDQFSVFFSATRGSKLGQHRPKANQFWTLTQQMYTLNLKSIERLLFQIMVGNPGRTGGLMHNIPMSPPDFVGGDNKKVYAQGHARWLALKSGCAKIAPVTTPAPFIMQPFCETGIATLHASMEWFGFRSSFVWYAFSGCLNASRRQ